jgi:glycerol-3-phosphate acyltransferase PlsX
MRIAVDAMGGDFAPENPINGAVLAARELDVEVVLVGDEAVVRSELDRLGNPSGVTVAHAEEAIGMDESAAMAVRRKRKSSIHEGARLVRAGEVRGFVSAGNTGAVMAVAKVIIGTLDGIERPALAVVLPTQKRPAVVLDVGAVIDPKPEQLLQFAIMGSYFARELLSVERPRVGLLSIGEEDIKGNDLIRAAHALLRKTPLNFIGNVEANDLYRGGCDVVVCDGFTGNILLKTSEAAAETLRYLMREEFTRTLTGKVAGLLARGAFSRLRRRVDYAEFGGAPLLGLRGLTVICHGRSSDVAIRNAVRVATEHAEHGVNRRIEEAIRAIRDEVAARETTPEEESS